MTARYTVTQLARLSGVSVRTLHHYDEIGLLKPAHVGDNRYRYYGREELWRLQDILFHRELGVPLAEIGAMLANEDDRLAVLHRQRGQLAERLAQTSDLLRTIDRTIAALTGEDDMSDKDIYQGFDPAKQEAYEAEVVAMHGEQAREVIETSKTHLGQMSKGEMAAQVAEGEEAERALAAAFLEGSASDDDTLAPLFDRHRAWVASMWGRPCPPQAYAGLGDMYAGHPDFRSRYEAHGEGFTDWLNAGMKAYAANIAD